MNVTSSAFEPGSIIPVKHTGVGEDVSPPLQWSKVPEGTKSIALICDDPDAPSRDNPRAEGPWVHWVIYNIPPETTELAEGVSRDPDVQNPPCRQGKNSWPDGFNIGYRGPMPPPGSGPHRYNFKVYALDRMLELDSGSATKESLLAAMEGHVVAEGRLMGTFERKP